MGIVLNVESVYTIGQDYNFFFNCFRKETINPAKSPVSLRQYSITRIMSSSNDGAVRNTKMKEYWGFKDILINMRIKIYVSTSQYGHMLTFIFSFQNGRCING